MSTYAPSQSVARALLDKAILKALLTQYLGCQCFKYEPVDVDKCLGFNSWTACICIPHMGAET